MSNFRIARSLDTMRTQVNQHAPNRNRAADGWIGDAAHASRTSDHNPWVRHGGMGIVTALDITHDPRNGVDTYRMADQMRITRDPRIKYVISNRRIFSSTSSAWTWRNYTGSSPHTGHVHISVNSTANHFDDARTWELGLGAPIPTAPPVPDDRPAARPVLRNGSRGLEVRNLQSILLVTVDGIFGPITERAVRDFQRTNGLTADGIVGPLTWGALDKIEQLYVPYETEPHLFDRAITNYDE